MHQVVEYIINTEVIGMAVLAISGWVFFLL